jgi:hypothetical protein
MLWSNVTLAGPLVILSLHGTEKVAKVQYGGVALECEIKVFLELLAITVRVIPMDIALQEEPLLVANLREVDVEDMNIPADFFE